MKALYIDSNSQRCDTIRRWFESYDYEIHSADSIASALCTLDLANYDIALIEQDSQQVTITDAITFVSRMEDAHGVVVDDLSDLAGKLDPLLAIAQVTTAELRPGQAVNTGSQRLVEIMERVCRIEHELSE